jgi:FkbM family methyltransferase
MIHALKNIFAKNYPEFFKFSSYFYHYHIVRNFWLFFNKPKGTLVYVGLNVGESFSRVSYKYKRSIGYEPNPRNFKILERKFGNSANVKLFNLACGDKDCTAEFNISNNANDMASSSLADFSESRNITSQGKILVQVVNLGEHLKGNGINNVDMYISDTEGYDLIILKTLDEYLKCNKIKSVVCEVVRDGRESPFKNIDNYESSFDDYLPYQYKKIASGWTRLTPYVYDDVPESFNFMDVMWINENFESNVL